jgi:hypothetical protein
MIYFLLFRSFELKLAEPPKLDIHVHSAESSITGEVPHQGSIFFLFSLSI